MALEVLEKEALSQLFELIECFSEFLKDEGLVDKRFL